MYSLSTSGMAELWFRFFEYYHAYRSGNTFNECLYVVLVKQDFKGKDHYDKVKVQIKVAP